MQHIEIELTNDFKTELWKKLIVSSSIGGLTAYTGRPVEIFSHPHYRHLFQELIKEGIEVANADGAHIEADFKFVALDKLLLLCNLSPEKGSSMLTDKLLGRPIELNAKNGCIVQKGIEYNIETPIHSRVVSALSS